MPFTESARYPTKEPSETYVIFMWPRRLPIDLNGSGEMGWSRKVNGGAYSQERSSRLDAAAKAPREATTRGRNCIFPKRAKDADEVPRWSELA